MLPRILLVCAMLVASPVAWSDAPTTSLKVKVTTLSGKPIDRASVVVRFVEGRSIAGARQEADDNYQLRTNQEGIAKIPPIPRASCTSW